MGTLPETAARSRGAADRIRELARDAKNALQIKSRVLAAKRQGDIRARLGGLETVLRSASGSTVLDLGCFDGLIAYEFARSGASLVHGLDNDAFHLDTAARIFSQVDVPARFVHADLRKPDPIRSSLGDEARLKYDIVLFLGVFQHIFRDMTMRQRQHLVDGIVERCGSLLAVRVPRSVWSEFERHLPARGLEFLSTQPHTNGVGELRTYRVAAL